MLKQIVRQVVAVSVDVPGQRRPALELGPDHTQHRCGALASLRGGAQPGQRSTQPELALADATGVSATSGKIPPTITGGVVETTPQSIDGTPLRAPTNQVPVASFVSTNPWMIVIAFGAGLGLMLTVFGVGFAIYRRRHRNT
jgi:hypothetical protein